VRIQDFRDAVALQFLWQEDSLFLHGPQEAMSTSGIGKPIGRQTWSLARIWKANTQTCTATSIPLPILPRASRLELQIILAKLCPCNGTQPVCQSSARLPDRGPERRWLRNADCSGCGETKMCRALAPGKRPLARDFHRDLAYKRPMT
jgi:hypothetical protein